MRNIFKKFIPQLRKDTEINYILLSKINEIFILDNDGVIIKESFFNFEHYKYILDSFSNEKLTNEFKFFFEINGAIEFAFMVEFYEDNYKEYLHISLRTNSGNRMLDYEYIKKNDNIILIRDSTYDSSYKINFVKSTSEISLFLSEKTIYEEWFHNLKFENNIWKYKNFEFNNKRLYKDPESIEEELSLIYDIDFPISKGINVYNKCNKEIKEYSNRYINEN